MEFIPKGYAKFLDIANTVEIQHSIRKECYAGDIESRLFKGGIEHKILKGLWSDDEFFQQLCESGIGRGLIRYIVKQEPDGGWGRALDPYYFVEGYVVLNLEQCKNYITARNNPSPQDIYLPPYIKFMLEAVKALGIEKGKRIKKVTIEEWMKENWPKDELGKNSDTMISSMATFVRDPGDTKGGYIPQ
ncbi:MAG: hypothetical protein HQL74_14325 [Magnetococcales bacterium]|nr:hypothetical protein [Magnetococcales bacterium]